MPTCPSCNRLVSQGNRCDTCGIVQPEVTAFDVPDVRLSSPEQDGKSDGICFDDRGVHPLRPKSYGTLPRAPIARLIAIDDDSDHEGEVFRIRRSEMTIGRRDADVNFPNDADISGTHAAIVRTVYQDGKEPHWSWMLQDCDSTNGVFVRFAQFALGANERLMIGAVEFTWENSSKESDAVLSARETGLRYRIRGSQPVTIGSSSANSKLVLDDVTIDPIHATLNQQGYTWVLNDNDSRNGIWLKTRQSPLINGSRFMLGQQRFRFEDGQSAVATCEQKP